MINQKATIKLCTKVRFRDMTVLVFMESKEWKVMKDFYQTWHITLFINRDKHTHIHACVHTHTHTHLHVHIYLYAHGYICEALVTIPSSRLRRKSF